MHSGRWLRCLQKAPHGVCLENFAWRTHCSTWNQGIVLKICVLYQVEEGEPSHIASQSNLWSRDEPNATQLFSELVQIRNRASASVGVLVKCRIVVCVYDQLLPCPLSFLADVIDSNRNGGALEYIKQE